MSANDHICCCCSKEPLSKNEIGVNRKLIDKAPKQFYCFKCLAEYLEVTEEELKEIVEVYKQQGCSMFE